MYEIDYPLNYEFNGNITVLKIDLAWNNQEWLICL